jgi:hypothetical protein
VDRELMRVADAVGGEGVAAGVVVAQARAALAGMKSVATSAAVAAQSSIGASQM